jgi:CTP:molybdopterin cytidylyltransferase MocA
MIPAIILAAGDSLRMGRPKALLSMGPSGESFLDRIVSVLRDGGVEEIVVVLGRDADTIRAGVAFGSRPVRFVDNPRPEEGQLSSLLAGLRAIDRPGVRAALVTLIDLPLVTSDTVRSILTAYRQGGAAIVRPARAGRHGHPVIFDRTLFQELQHADPESGARSVIHAHDADIRDVEAADEGVFADIDTPADYQRFVLSR